MALGRLAMHCATIPLFGLYILEDEGMDIAAPKHPQVSLVFTDPPERARPARRRRRKMPRRARRRLRRQLSAIWRFSFGEQIIGEGSRAAMFRSLFFDHMIHHVAQLGVYLRLNDLPVPGLYGPSADEQWSPK